ncbi:unnamed protein product [Prunus armeniaca]|uniref:Cytochrome P450 n=1 Tax=Prunus armeniaca TaxID=36596 RepID=A0A6J5TTP7_PRUAR|nr:unnamed protein product [Prunus armeniaca]
MDLQLSSLVALVVVTFAFSLFIRSRFCKPRAVRKSPPLAGGAWPIMGHLRLFKSPAEPLHMALGKLADKYGPIFTIKYGVERAVVVSSSEMAKECLKTHDKVFSSRVQSVVSEILGYNYAFFAFSTYGRYFHEIKKKVMHELFSNHRIEMLKHVRESEVSTSIREIYEQWTKNKKSGGSNEVVVEMKEWFGDISENVIFRMILGQRCTEAKNYAKNPLPGELMGRKIFHDVLHMLGTVVLSDAVPFLRWLDLGGHQKAMRKKLKEVDQLLQVWLDEHKQKRKISGGVKGDDERDFMDTMISFLDDDLKVTKEYDADTINKATALTILLAGVDVTTGTLSWALSLLLNNPETLKRAQEELDQIIGRERQVKESDIDNLVYLQAVLKETMRLYPPGPVPLAHVSTEDCILGGYHIPAKTRVFINIGKIQLDPKTWPEPNEFRPERFLTTHKNIDVRGQDFELIPFSSGRRMCAGLSLAMKMMPLALASLLHGFEIATPSDEPVDMSENMELTNHKSSLLEVVVTPRLPAQLYE